MAKQLGARHRVDRPRHRRGNKNAILLEELEQPVAYVPVDISGEQLQQSSALFRKLFPISKCCRSAPIIFARSRLPTPKRRPTRKVVYFPGSTIGNFEPDIALEFSATHSPSCAAEDGGLLIGVDLQKAHEVLERAYNDAQGVTAQFNLNLLTRANRELGADFRPGPVETSRDLQRRSRSHRNAFDQRTRSNCSSRRSRISISTRGERIVTEYSYKHTPEGFAALAARAGFDLAQLWTDDARLFGVFYFTVISR